MLQPSPGIPPHKASFGTVKSSFRTRQYCSRQGFPQGFGRTTLLSVQAYGDARRLLAELCKPHWRRDCTLLR